MHLKKQVNIIYMVVLEIGVLRTVNNSKYQQEIIFRPVSNVSFLLYPSLKGYLHSLCRKSSKYFRLLTPSCCMLSARRHELPSPQMEIVPPNSGYQVAHTQLIFLVGVCICLHGIAFEITLGHHGYQV